MKKPIRKELLDELLAEYANPEDLTGPEGLLKRLTGALVERALQAELTDHLGYEPNAAEGQGTGNSRNGAGKKTLRTDQGNVTVEVPRDRNGTFEPKLIKKHQRSFNGFDDKILSMYARGMSVRDIQAHLAEIYGTEISPDLISRVTDAVVDEVQTWQARPLDSVWPIVFLDALVIKVRDQGVVQNKSCLHRARHGRRRTQGSPGNLARKHRRREVLAEGDQRAEKPRRSRHPHRLLRRTQGLPSGHRGRVSEDGRANVHRAHDSQLHALRRLGTAQGGLRRAAQRLRGAHRTGRARRARCV
jgi:hypothetical protein